MGNYFSPEKETASREQITQWQTAGFLDAVKRVYENVPYYREKMEEKGVTPDDIKDLSDLSKLPFLTKDDLREAYPYGLLGTDLHFTRKMMSVCGMSAVQGRSSLQAAQRMTLSRYPMDLVSSPVEQA